MSWILVFFLGIVSVSTGMDFGVHHRECEKVTIPMCSEMPYNITRMPNFMGHYSQTEAAIQAHEYLPLVDIECSPYARFFICSVYAPLCSPVVPDPIPACRFVCEAVRDSCLPVLRTFNFSWNLDCSMFPKSDGDDGICMELPDLVIPSSSSPAPELSRDTSKLSQDPRYHCRPPRTWVPLARGNEGMCVPLCHQDFLFSPDDKHLAKIWMSSWASLCFVCTSFTFLTFLLQPSRFRYPEHPIICFAICHLAYSVAFVARLIFQHDFLSCESSTSVVHLAVKGFESSGCIFTFIIQYYFSLAASFWWLLLAFTWFLAAGRRWSSEALQSYSSFFHGAAWGLPALATILALALKRVDGNELTGLCFVGNLRPESHFLFVILPLLGLLATGSVFLALGFVALFRIRKVIQTEACLSASRKEPLRPNSGVSLANNNLDKLEKLMLRIGIFSALYIVPALCIIVCHFYQYTNYDAWVKRAAESCSPQRSHFLSTPPSVKVCTVEKSIPSIEVFLLQIFMSLFVGITSSIWVWSNKTMKLWKLFFIRHFTKRNNKFRRKGGVLYQKPVLHPLNAQQSHPICRSESERNSHPHPTGLIQKNVSRQSHKCPSINRSSTCGHKSRETRTNCTSVHLSQL